MRCPANQGVFSHVPVLSARPHAKTDQFRTFHSVVPVDPMTCRFHEPDAYRFRVIVGDDFRPVVEEFRSKRLAVVAWPVKAETGVRVDTYIPSAKIHGAGRQTDIAADFDALTGLLQEADFVNAVADDATTIISDDECAGLCGGKCRCCCWAGARFLETVRIAISLRKGE